MPDRVENFIVEQSLPGARLDVFLRGKFPALSRGTMQRLIGQDLILVNGQTVKPTHTPRAGDKIEIHWPEARPPRRSRRKSRSTFYSRTSRCSSLTNPPASWCIPPPATRNTPSSTPCSTTATAR